MTAKKRKSSTSGVVYVLISILVILVIIVILYRLYYRVIEKKAPPPTEEKAPFGLEEAYLYLEKIRNSPDFPWPVVLTDQILPEVVEHTYFSIGYVEDHEQAAWVAYLISRVHTQNNSERRNNFRADPMVMSESASPKDYTQSGYDRGHLAPAADFDFSNKALSETFLMSNISPQEPSFNRGKWKELEDQVRSWASEKDSLWVITGPVLEKDLKKIGRNRVSVPKYFYKIIFDCRQPKISAIGFLMPNERISQHLRNFVVPVDSIEKVSGLDFFPQIPDVLEERLEKDVQLIEWF